MDKVIKKVFSLLSKVLFKQEIERNTHCIHCGKKLTGNQRKFCSDKCNNTYWRKQYSTKHKMTILKYLKGNERG